MKPLVIIGAGDFGREVICLIERINISAGEKIWDLIGFVDDNPELNGKSIDGYPVLGSSRWLQDQNKEVYAVCSVGVGKIREKIIKKFDNVNIKYATLIDPEAILFKDCTIGQGSIICAGSVISVNVTVKEHTIVNLNCTLGHDACINEFCTINPGTNISGKVKVDKCTDLGTGTKIIQGVSIGKETTIGAGAVVIRDIPDKVLAVGCPAIIVKTK